MKPRHVQFDVIITFFPIWRLISAPSSLYAEQAQWLCNNHLGIFFSSFFKVALGWWLRIISTSYLLRAVLHYTYCIPYITVPWNPNQTPCIKRPSLDVKSRLGFIKTYADKAAFRPGKGKKGDPQHDTTTDDSFQYFAWPFWWYPSEVCSAECAEQKGWLSVRGE